MKEKKKKNDEKLLPKAQCIPEPVTVAPELDSLGFSPDSITYEM